MLYFGRVGSSWGHRTFFGSSWGENVITPKKNVRNQKYMPFKKIKTTYSCLLEID
jgi:hypothetical protein